jgi:hypothetical protein
MTTILVKNVSTRLERELRRLKAELGCRTWAELLAKLVESETLREPAGERLLDMRAGVNGFLKLRTAVSDKWPGPPNAVEEIRKSRSHDA